MKIAHIHVWDKKNKGDVSIVMAVQQLLKNTFGKAEITDFPVEVLKKNISQDLKDLNKADLIVIGGGGIYYSWFTPFNIEFINKLNPPVVIFGVGYIREYGSPSLRKNDIKSIVSLNRKAVLISVRDNYTKKFLIRAGVPNKKIAVIGDPAIFLKEKKSKIGLSSKLKIGINLNYSGWMGFGKYEKKIIRSFSKVCYYFKKYRNAKIYYLMHHPDEKNVYHKINCNGLKVINLPPMEQKFIYGKMNLVIGMMLHSAVLSFGANTPEINVAYDLRNRSFADFIGFPELLISSKKITENLLLETAIKVINNEKFYRDKFKEKKEKISLNHQQFLQKIKKYV
ncbi:polysaccharide pyruvyl transferase family protein [Candidatus Parcubacteria bacterium]|nr:MAG: polysaccharide pyruvyl transferase family protein [Candidatus Parcubacteria bacterium]